jgi:ATP synthase protein I
VAPVGRRLTERGRTLEPAHADACRSDVDPRRDPSTDTDARAHAQANPEAADPHADANTGCDTRSATRSHAHAGSDADSHAAADTDSRADADARPAQSERVRGSLNPEAQLLYSRRFARGPMNGLGPVGAYIAILSEVGLVLLVTILAGVLAGVWVDSQLRTGPIFLLVGLGLGLTAGFIGSYRLMTRFMSRYDR